MIHIVIGPFLFAAGLALIFVAIHGMPKAPALASLSRFRPARRVPRNGFTSADALVGEILSEMMTLREQLADLQEQVASSKGRGRRTAKLAS
jgi:hypothetical protein